MKPLHAEPDGVVEDSLQILYDMRREHLPDRPSFLLENGSKEMGEAFIEGSPEFPVGKGLRQVVFREEAVSNGSSHRGCESGLVFRDRPLEEGEGSAEELRWLIRMKEHPDGHGVSEAPCEGAENHGENRLKDLFGHGQRCLWRMNPWTG